MLDLLIRDGIVLDGTGKDPYYASIGISQGIIQEIGALKDAEAENVIDASGLYVTPGFINTHSHSDLVLLFESMGENILSQGITTEVVGNCGESVIPLSEAMLSSFKSWLPSDQFKTIQHLRRDTCSVMEYIEKSKPGINVAFMVGHGTIRSEVLGFADRPPSASEMDAMKTLLAEAMEAGAFGLTSGLIYPPGVFAREDELVELCKTVSAYDGIYASHMRSESDHVIESVEETIRVAEEAGLPVIVSHHKIAGKKNWGKSEQTLELIDKANQKGLKVRCDQYPYNAGATNLISALPPVYASKGQSEYLNMLSSPEIRQKIKQLLRANHADFENLITHSGHRGVLILNAPFTPYAQGKTINDLAIECNQEPEDTIFDLIIANKGNIDAAFFSMEEEDIQRIMKSPYSMGGTDSFLINPYLTCDHPRFKGSFIKLLSEYVREKKLIPLKEAVRKLTSMPADVVGLKSKGVLAKGYDADIVIFDYANLCAASDFAHPLAPNEGVHYVLVNGKISIKNDKLTGVRAGKILRKQ